MTDSITFKFGEPPRTYKLRVDVLQTMASDHATTWVFSTRDATPEDLIESLIGNPVVGARVLEGLIGKMVAPPEQLDPLVMAAWKDAVMSLEATVDRLTKQMESPKPEKCHVIVYDNNEDGWGHECGGALPCKAYSHSAATITSENNPVSDGADYPKPKMQSKWFCSQCVGPHPLPCFIHPNDPGKLGATLNAPMVSLNDTPLTVGLLTRCIKTVVDECPDAKDRLLVLHDHLLGEAKRQQKG